MINDQSSPLFLKQRIFIFEVVKRTTDIVSSLFFIILFSPILLVVALCIKLTSPGPVIFKQKRVGQGNHEFEMFKFRSMYSGDNDKRLKEQYPDLWEKYKKSDWKLPASEDPRITSIGKFIRATSIDEMPQFFNILKGDMSLVGPRAYRDDELREYEKKYPQTKKHIDIIRTAKPGLTGLWQTSGRNDLSFEKRAELDANYIKNRSLRQEFFINLKTPFAMWSRW
jgi:lipopolysaccharide/colanic/teichoic acid biosynthesis glycosyltransferase